MGSYTGPSMSCKEKVHFGMGNNDLVDRVTIDWPSGYTQKINDVPYGEHTFIEPVLVEISDEDRHVSPGDTFYLTISPRLEDPYQYGAEPEIDSNAKFSIDDLVAFGDVPNINLISNNAGVHEYKITAPENPENGYTVFDIPKLKIAPRVWYE